MQTPRWPTKTWLAAMIQTARRWALMGLLLGTFCGTFSGTLAAQPAAKPTRVVVVSDLNESYGSTRYSPAVDEAVCQTIALAPDVVISTGDMVAGQRLNRKQWDGRPHPQRLRCAKVEAVLQALGPRGASVMTITTVGLDLAKNVFQAHGVDERNKAGLRKQLKRGQMAEFFANLPPCLIGIEACGSAHHWALKLQSFGHTARLMAPQFVKPYVKTNKNDAADAEAICEAVARPNMRFVPIKNIEQQAVLPLQRARQWLLQLLLRASQCRHLVASVLRGVVFGLLLEFAHPRTRLL